MTTRYRIDRMAAWKSSNAKRLASLMAGNPTKQQLSTIFGYFQCYIIILMADVAKNHENAWQRVNRLISDLPYFLRTHHSKVGRQNSHYPFNILTR